MYIFSILAKSSCRKQNYASHEFLSSPGGYYTDSLTQDTCKDLCAEYQFAYSGFVTGLFCLCGNDTTDFDETDSSNCNSACPGDSNQICGSNNTDLIYIIPASTVETIDDVVIDLSSEEVSTKENLKMDFIIQSSANFEVRLDFGDGTSMKNNEDHFTYTHAYFIPGEYKIKASVVDLSKIQPALFAETFVTVEDKEVSFLLFCPKVAEPGVLIQCQVFLTSGSFVSMTYRMSQGDEYVNVDIPDTSYVSFGILEPFDWTENGSLNTGANLVYSPFTRLDYHSYLIGFRYKVVKEGKFEFLVLRPKCDSGTYCAEISGCSSVCSDQGILQCRGSNEYLCSLTSRCTDPNDPPFCPSNNTLSYEIVHSFKTESVQPGFEYFKDIPSAERFILPGDIFGFKTDGSSAIFSRSASSVEMQNGFQDASDQGGLGVLHYYKPIVIEYSNVTLEYIYNKTGKHQISVELGNPWMEDTATQNEDIFVEIPLSGIELTITNKNLLIKKEESVCIQGNGSSINLHWEYGDGSNETFYDDVIPESGLCFEITCQSDGEKVLNVTLTNHWNETSVYDTFLCFYSIGKDWTLSSNSPKSAPPGNISFELKFVGSYPLSPFEYTVSFGDDSTQNAIKIEKVEDPIQFSHSYRYEGNFTVTVNLSNPIDIEIFEHSVQVFEKMGNLSVTPYFVKSGSYPKDKLELKGKNNSDANLGSTVYFENSITGHVSSYRMEFEDGSYTEEFEDAVFSHSFPELGEWTINFTAWNSEVEERSNTVQLIVRILTDISDFEFTSSSFETPVDEDVEFLIALSDFDRFSCVIFNGGDSSRLLAFGNKETCTIYYDENQFKYIKKTEENSRKRRAVNKAEWSDENTIRILYSYMFGGQFFPSVDVFNSVSQVKKNLSIAVSDKEYLGPLVWIDKNSTDLSSPIECQRGYDCRYETTAIFSKNESYLASHAWTAFKINSDGKEVEEIDLSHLKTHNCSALRVTKRSLEFGLYKLKYTLTVYHEEYEETEKKYEQEYNEEYVDYYYAAPKLNIEDEEVYDNLYENLTLISRKTVYSYLKIIPSPLIPMLINGGASYLLRGFGQKIYLEPTVYSEDLDYPDEKNFDVTWYCLCSDKNEVLSKKGEHDYVNDNPSKPITDRSRITEDKGGCFGKGPGLMEVDTADYELSSDSFIAWDTLYELIAVIKKDNKVTEGHLFVKIIEKKPPSLKVKCEKRVACFPEVKGLYVNPNLFVPLKVECTEDCGEGDLRFEWNLYASDLKTRKKIPIDNWQKHATVDFDRMGLNQSLYEENPGINIFLIEVIGILPDPNIPRGESYLFLILNHPPMKGQCVISESAGMALLDVFTVQFSGWEDEDGHEIDDYSIYVTYGNESLRLVYGTKTEVKVVLPYGDLQIWCTASDYLGAQTKYSIANFSTILPTEKEFEDYEKQRFFEKFLAEGKMSLASQVIIAKNSIVMEYRRRQNKSGNFDDVRDADIDNRWKEYWEQDGIDSSYYTDQARDEIREELRELLEKQMDWEAKKKNKEIDRLLRLPMEALADAEIFGGALSAIADTGPTDLSGKLKIMKGMGNIFDVINDTEVPHPEEKRIVFSQFGNLADTVAGSLAESHIGGHFLPAEMKKAEQELNYNATEPNYFIFYVEGNRTEVKNNLTSRTVEAAKEDQLANAKSMVLQIKEMITSIQQNCMEEIMSGPDPFFTESKKGFQMTFYKNHASNLSGLSIQQGASSVTLPDLCSVLAEDCNNESFVIGVQAVRWTQPLESYGADSNKLSRGSNVIQINITPRDGNTTIPVNNTKDPFTICIPVTEEGSKMEYIKPSFSRVDDILVYHTLFIESPGIAATVNIKPDDSKAPIVVIYQYGELPSLMDYDGILRLQDVKLENGVFRLFIGSDIITESGKNLSIGIGHAANNTNLDLFFSNPENFNLSVVNMTNKFSTNYAIEITTAGCYYFNDEEKWSTEGCTVVESKPGMTCCACNHLTSFGSGLFIAPNEINFSYVFANADIAQNITIYATIIVTFSLFILLLIFARWKDRKDLQKLGASPLPDNESADKYVYEILVYTGHQSNAGTKSNVYFIASGEDDETEVRHLADNKRPILRNGSVDVFVMSVPRCLGQLNYLRIWHDNSGSGKWSSWFCQYIIFRDVQTGHKFEFLVNRWFAVEYDDGMIDRLVPVAGREQVSEFSHLFSTNSRRNMADNHLWLSVFLRPPRSRFTRVQRICCCMAVLCLSMLTNAMYYQRTSAKPLAGAFKFGPLSLSSEEISVGIISNFLIFPPTFIMIFFFRKSRPRILRPSRIEEALKRQRLEWKQKNPEPPVTAEHHPLKSDAEAQLLQRPRKKKFALPWWCVGFGWFFVVASIALSLFFLWAYGIEFGDEKTSRWLKSLVISFFSSVLITQPIKIILMAIVVSCMCRSMDYDNDDADEDEEDPHLNSDEEYLHNYKRSQNHLRYEPIDLEALEHARKEREKEVKMFEVIREISAYFFFLWVIMILSYGNRDPSNFYLRQALINGFVKPGDQWVDFNKVNTEKRFWNWTLNALVPELFAMPWYNNRTPLGLRLYLDDRNNLKIGYAVLRQVRIQPRSCDVSWLIESVTPECAGFGSMIFEDGTLYTKGWRTVNSTETLVPPEYKYLTASQLKGYPFWGQMDWYGGGGYVVPLVAQRDSGVKRLLSRLKALEQDGWVDRHTRAVFVEFGVYNAQLNLFCAATLVAEFLPGGGVSPYYHVDPIRLLGYHGGAGWLQLAVEVAFVVFTIAFTVRELRALCRLGPKEYLGQFWNVAELTSIAVSYTGIANHAYKLVATAEILRVFTETEGTGYVKLQEAVLLNELFCYQIGLVMSISTLKFLKLLRFNKRIGVLSSTLRACASELGSYSVCLLVVFGAFVALFWLLFGRYVRAFATLVGAFEASISMMLKKFDYDAMVAAQPVLAPAAFFTFSLATAVVLINILLSIIIRSFEDVKHDVNKQGNEYEILEFFLQRMRAVLGCGGGGRVRPLPPPPPAQKDSVAAFPGKVDRLVDFINDFYFENQMDFSGNGFLRKMTDDLAVRKAKPTLAPAKSKIPKSVAERFDDF